MAVVFAENPAIDPPRWPHLPVTAVKTLDQNIDRSLTTTMVCDVRNVPEMTMDTENHPNELTIMAASPR